MGIWENSYVFPKFPFHCSVTMGVLHSSSKWVLHLGDALLACASLDSPLLDGNALGSLRLTVQRFKGAARPCSPFATLSLLFVWWQCALSSLLDGAMFQRRNRHCYFFALFAWRSYVSKALRALAPFFFPYISSFISMGKWEFSYVFPIFPFVVGILLSTSV